MAKLFISYRRSDHVFTGRVYDRLKDRFGAANVFKDVDSIPLGKDFRKVLGDEIHGCSAVIVVMGENWVDMRDEFGARRLEIAHDFVRTEIELALERDIAVIPLLLDKAEMPNASELPESIRDFAFRHAARVRPDPDFDNDILRLCNSIESQLAGVPSNRPAAATDECPYRGLESFRIDDSRYYFGRDNLLATALDHVRRFSRDSELVRLLAIVGASGSGKSSLAHAGVLAHLRTGECRDWPIVVCRPGHDALEGLAIALKGNAVLGGAVGDVGELIDKLKQDERRLHLVVRLALESQHLTNNHVVILIDQFEELFRPGPEDVRRGFINNILHAARVREGKSIVVLTMRADFYAKASVYPDLAEALTAHQILVGPMNEECLRSAIMNPARLVGAELESGLVELLLQDMADEPGALPFLQDALTQLWERRRDGHLTVADYKEIGGLKAGIEHRANQLYESFNDNERDLCRRLFLRLTQPGEGTEDTKRRILRSDCGDSDDVERMIQTLATARLITTETDRGSDGQVEMTFVEVSHEALIRGWSRLRQWIDENRDALRVQHQISADAAVWSRTPNDDFLYRGARLAVTEEWLSDHGDALTEKERAFIAASQSLRDREELEKARAASRLRRSAWLAAIAAVLALACAAVATVMWRTAEGERAVAESAKRLEEQQRIQTERMLYNQKFRALSKSWESQDVPSDLTPLLQELAPKSRHAADPRGWEYGFLTRQLTETFDHVLLAGEGTAAATHARWSADGKRLATVSADNTIRIWNSGNFQRVFQFQAHEAPISSIAWAPDGTKLASASTDSKIIVWDMVEGKIAREFYSKSKDERERPRNARATTSPSNVHVTWSPNSSRIAIGDGSSRILIVSLDPAGAFMELTSTDDVHFGMVAWNPTKDIVAAEDGKQIHLFDVAKKAHGDSGVVTSVRSIRWDAQGERLACLSGVGQLEVYVPTDAMRLGTAGVAYAPSGARDAAWAPAGNYIALTGDNGYARFWGSDFEQGYTYFVEMPEVHKLTYFANAIDWSRDDVLAVACGDGNVRIWKASMRTDANATDQELIASVQAVDWCQASGLVAIARGTDMVEIWDTETESLLRKCRLRRSSFVDVEFAPDGKHLAAADANGAAVLFNVSDGRHVRSFAPTKRSGSGDAASTETLFARSHGVAWRATGQWLFATHGTSDIFVWNTDDGALVRTLTGHKDAITCLTSSRTDDVLASACMNGDVHVWDVASGKPTYTWREPFGYVQSLAMSPDGSRFAVAGKEGAILVLEPPSTKSQLRIIESGWHANCVLYSPDGNRILAGDGRGNIMVWDSVTGQALIDLRNPALADTETALFARRAIAISRDGKELLGRVPGGLVRLWNRNHVLRERHSGSVLSQNLVASGAVWKYDDSGSDLGTAWRDVDYDDSHWSSGASPLGYGDSGLNTIVGFGPDANRKYVTTYFRHSFAIDSNTPGSDLIFGIMRDDAAAVYLNGTEVVRDNLASGATYDALARSHVDSDEEPKQWYFRASPSLLRKGKNVLAVEIHQDELTSSDIRFDLHMTVMNAGDLLAFFDHARNKFRQEAAEILNQISIDLQENAPILLDVLNHGEPALQLTSLSIMARSPEISDVTIPALRTFLHEAADQHSEDVVVRAFETLHQLGVDRTELSALLDTMLTHHDAVVRAAACRAAVSCDFGTPEIVSRAMDLFQDDSHRVRGFSAIVVARFIPERVISESILPPPRNSSELSIRSDWANRLHAASFDIVITSNGSTADFRRALADIQVADALNPDNPGIKNTLAAAHFRLGNYKDAIDTLNRSMREFGVEPDDLAVLAMTYHKMGDARASRAMERLKLQLAQYPYPVNSRERIFAGEAERLILNASRHVLDCDLIPHHATWSYLDDGTDPGSEWRALEYNDAHWKRGAAELGYGDGDEATIVGYGPDERNKYVTTYFRHEFQVENASDIDHLIIDVIRDDGVVLYLNGTLIVRDNLSPSDAFDEIAHDSIDGNGETTPLYVMIDPKLLRGGRNVLAAELHQQRPSSSDLSFQLGLTSNPLPKLIEELQSGNQRPEAVRALGSMGPAAAEAVPGLIPLLENRDKELRYETARAIGEIRAAPEMSVPAIMTMLYAEPDPFVIIAAGKALLTYFPLDADQASRFSPGTIDDLRVGPDLWLAHAFVHRHLTPRDLISKGEFAAPSGEIGTYTGIEAEIIQSLRILDGLLNALAQDPCLRMNCGKTESAVLDGKQWIPDAFYMGPSNVELIQNGSSNPSVFGVGRRFINSTTLSHSGYHVPMPPGSYKVTLHFVRPTAAWGPSNFDVLMENKMVVETVEMQPDDTAELSVKTANIQIADGILDILFRQREGDVTVAAIEVEPIK